MSDDIDVTRRALVVSTLLTLSLPPLSAAKPVYRDPELSMPVRVADLLGRMTLEEKAAQMRSMWATKVQFLDAQGNFSQERAALSLGNGIGQIARPSDTRGFAAWESQPFRSIDDTVRLVNSIQRFLVEKTRLGIPALFHDELAHGLLANDATIFPIPPGLASTWDPDLVERVFAVAAREARLRGTHVALTPVVDLMRDPRYGRAEEFFGEDPYLVAQMGIAAVRGLQGRHRPLERDHVFATLKHFVHGAPQGGLNIGPADISERTLRESFLVPFAEVIKHADPAIIMPSYNEVGGVPSHANVELLQTTGRQRLGFHGAYFSDYEGIGNLMEQHHIAANKEDAAVLAVNAGVMADLPEGASYARLPELVRAGRVKEALVDSAVSQILALKFEAGLFDNPYLDRRRVRRETNTPADIELARTTAERALILLKNDGILPLEPKSGMVLAVIGPNSIEPLLGGYSGENTRSVGILEGLENAAPPGVTIEQSDGVWITAPDAQGRHRSYSPLVSVPEPDDLARIADAVEVAKRADVVLLVVGDVPAITREAIGPNLPGDRSALRLWGRQDALVDAMISTGKPIVALLLNGRPLAVSHLAQHARALLEGWYLGQEGGNAFANVIFGRTSPGGKLTVSFPRSVGELPAYYNQHPSAYVNRYLEGKPGPLFPFGHGLSYTTFEISAPRLSKACISSDEAVDVDVTIVNSGERYGNEVVQLYIRDDVSSVPRPVLELKGFQRVSLARGERTNVNFRLTPDSLAFWNIDMKWAVEPGTFTILAGSSSVDLKSVQLIVRGK